MESYKMTNYGKVKEFNVVNGIPVFETIQSDIFDESPELVKLRYDLIYEEGVNELKEAINDDNYLEIVDALADTMYVVYGAGCSFGINMDDDFLENSNFGNKLRPKRFIIAKHFLETKSDEIKFQILAIEHSIKRKDIYGISKNLKKIIVLIREIGNTLDIDLSKAMDLVHKSNMTKLCSDENEAIQTVEWYLKNDTRYDSPSYRKCSHDKYSDSYIVFNESSGKILKCINWKLPDFGYLSK